MGDKAEVVVDEEDKKQLIKDEVEAAFEEELGKDWLEEKSTPVRILVQFLRIFTVLVALYFFLVSLSLMGDGFTALSGKGAGELFVGNDSPIVGLMVGILATVLVQSSSTTTSIIVVLVANEIVEVTTAIPMVMGANIGTSVTNTIVSLGFADNTEAYRRGFAGATVHDMFNYLNVLLFLPLELLVSAIRGDNGGGLLQTVAEEISDARGDGELKGGSDFKDANPIKKITNPILDKIIDINKDVIEDYAQGFPDEPENKAACDTEFNFENDVGLDGCVDGTDCDFCPNNTFDQDLYDRAKQAFDDERLIDGGRFEDFGDRNGGIAALVISLLMLIISLGIIVRTLTAIVQGSAKKVLVKTLNYNFVGGGYLAIVVGCGLTFIVQSSSITTSILTPLVAVDALSLENMFPYTLGANIGTTGTGLIAAATSGKSAGYTIALVHLFFNIFGTFFWYPIPALRNIPIGMARFLGEMAAIWKIIPIIYILTMFIFYPLIFFGLSAGFRGDGVGGKAAAGIALAALIAIHGYAAFWYRHRDGKNKFIAYVKARKERLGRKAAGDELVGAAAEEPASV